MPSVTKEEAMSKRNVFEEKVAKARARRLAKDRKVPRCFYRPHLRGKEQRRQAEQDYLAWLAQRA